MSDLEVFDAATKGTLLKANQAVLSEIDTP